MNSDKANKKTGIITVNLTLGEVDAVQRGLQELARAKRKLIAGSDDAFLKKLMEGQVKHLESMVERLAKLRMEAR